MKKKKPRTLQAKSIDFYGTREMDEGMSEQSEDADELQAGQVDFPQHLTGSRLRVHHRTGQGNPMVTMKR